MVSSDLMLGVLKSSGATSAVGLQMEPEDLKMKLHQHK